MQHIFMNNFQLCSEINERVVQHFVHCTETHGRHVQYLKFLQTIVKAENKFIKKCQDIVMAEVSSIICVTKGSYCIPFKNLLQKGGSVHDMDEKSVDSIDITGFSKKIVCIKYYQTVYFPDGELR